MKQPGPSGPAARNPFLNTQGRARGEAPMRYLKRFCGSLLCPAIAPRSPNEFGYRGSTGCRERQGGELCFRAGIGPWASAWGEKMEEYLKEERARRAKLKRVK